MKTETEVREAVGQLQDMKKEKDALGLLRILMLRVCI